MRRANGKSAYWRRKPAPGADRAYGQGQSIHERPLPGLDQGVPYDAIDEPARKLLGYAPIESFFKTLKVERIHQLRYGTRAQARLDIVDWIEGFYNLERLHSSIDYQTPAAAESSLMAA